MQSAISRSVKSHMVGSGANHMHNSCMSGGKKVRDCSRSVQVCFCIGLQGMYVWCLIGNLRRYWFRFDAVTLSFPVLQFVQSVFFVVSLQRYLFGFCRKAGNHLFGFCILFLCNVLIGIFCMYKERKAVSVM